MQVAWIIVVYVNYIVYLCFEYIRLSIASTTLTDLALHLCLRWFKLQCGVHMGDVHHRMHNI